MIANPVQAGGWRVAALLLAAGVCSAAQRLSQPQVTLFRCAGGRSFSVASDEKKAIVTASGTHYELRWRPSSIGKRYAARDATLILDGDFAAFVSRTAIDFDLCRSRPSGPR